MLLVTGGAGFIGSNLIADFNAAGRTDIVVSDVLSNGDNWRNLAKRHLHGLVPPQELPRWLAGRKLDAIVHLGAISDTTATDADRVLATNLRLSCTLLDWCSANGTPFIYASSAATYGDGSVGFDDDGSLRQLKPMNLYGFSKHLFDRLVVERAAAGQGMPPQWVGLKFFNVFGPNEYHKGEMMSLIAKRFEDVRAGRPVRLFKSHRAGVPDGEQKRDFIYVDDAVAVVRWLIDSPSVSGLYNVGTGVARSFRELITALFRSLARPAAIEYVEMPLAIRRQYQYFTQAKVEKLRRAGYNGGFTPIEEAVDRYVTSYLNRPDRYR